MHFQHDWPKGKKNYSSFNFLPENLEKLRSTELYGAALEGSLIFQKRISSCRMAMESSWLAELKYTIFSTTGRKTTKLRRSKLFLWTVFKHGLREVWVLALYKCLSCVSLVGWRVFPFLFFIFFFYFFLFFYYLFILLFYFILFYFFVDHWSSLLDLYIAWKSAMRFFIFRFRCYGIVMTLLLGRLCISSQPMGCWYVVGSSFL